MHIAASNPISLNIDSLDPKIIEKEKQVLMEQAVSSGKPKEIAEKMVEGRIRKFCEEVVLLEQTFVIDGKSKIKDILKKYSSELGTEVTIDSFKMLILGQGIEVEEKILVEKLLLLQINRKLDFEKIILEKSFNKIIW